MIVYFHGLGSSPNSDKVARLKAMFPNKHVYAFHADIDPEIAKKEVSDQIESVLVKHINEPGKVYFIGTSLGAWLASEMSDLFHVKTLMINPCYNPQESLKKYPDLRDEIRNKYTPTKIRLNTKTYAIDPYDPVIDMVPLMAKVGDSVLMFPGVGHRFNGPEFESLVQSWIKE